MATTQAVQARAKKQRQVTADDTNKTELPDGAIVSLSELSYLSSTQDKKHNESSKSPMAPQKGTQKRSRGKSEIGHTATKSSGRSKRAGSNRDDVSLSTASEDKELVDKGRRKKTKPKKAAKRNKQESEEEEEEEEEDAEEDDEDGDVSCTPEPLDDAGVDVNEDEEEEEEDQEEEEDDDDEEEEEEEEEEESKPSKQSSKRQSGRGSAKASSKAQQTSKNALTKKSKPNSKKKAQMTHKKRAYIRQTRKFAALLSRQTGEDDLKSIASSASTAPSASSASSSASSFALNVSEFVSCKEDIGSRAARTEYMQWVRENLPQFRDLVGILDAAHYPTSGLSHSSNPHAVVVSAPTTHAVSSVGAMVSELSLGLSPTVRFVPVVSSSAASTAAATAYHSSWKRTLADSHSIDLAAFKLCPTRHALQYRLRVSTLSINAFVEAGTFQVATRGVNPFEMTFHVSPEECKRKFFRCANAGCIHFYVPLKIEAVNVSIQGGPTLPYSVRVRTREDKMASASTKESKVRTWGKMESTCYQSEKSATEVKSGGISVPSSASSTKYVRMFFSNSVYSLSNGANQEEMTLFSRSPSTVYPFQLELLYLLKARHSQYSDLSGLAALLHRESRDILKARADKSNSSAHALPPFSSSSSSATLSASASSSSSAAAASVFERTLSVRAPDDRMQVPNVLSYLTIREFRNHGKRLVDTMHMKTTDDQVSRNEEKKRVDYFSLSTAQFNKIEAESISSAESTAEVMDVGRGLMITVEPLVSTTVYLDKMKSALEGLHVTIELRLTGLVCGGSFMPPGYLEQT